MIAGSTMSKLLSLWPAEAAFAAEGRRSVSPVGLSDAEPYTAIERDITGRHAAFALSAPVVRPSPST